MKHLYSLLILAAALLICQLASASTVTYSNIEDGSWNTCSRCAGAGGTGPATPHSMSHVSSPSMDGKSAQFNVGGSTPYANAYWWKEYSGSTSTNFIYDVYFYMKNPSSAHALEFDVNQYISGKQYIFGTECVMDWNPQWKIYDAYNHTWRSTSVYCSKPKAYSWNHLVIEFKRSSGKMAFVSVTLNGTKHYFNRSYSPRGSSSYKTTVAFQMDENGSATDYSVWLDKMKLTKW